MSACLANRATASSSCPRRTSWATSGEGSGICCSPFTSDGRRRQALFDPGGRGDVLRHAELLRLEAEGQADELREVQDGEAKVPADDLCRLGLLEVEVQVAEGAGRDEAVGARIEGVAQVGAGLAEGGLAVHRDHR